MESSDKESLGAASATETPRSSSVEERVKALIVEKLGVGVENVLPGSNFASDLGADSLDTVELIMAFEEEFGCEIPDAVAEKMVTVENVIAYLEANPGKAVG